MKQLKLTILYHSMTILILILVLAIIFYSTNQSMVCIHYMQFTSSMHGMHGYGEFHQCPSETNQESKDMKNL